MKKILFFGLFAIGLIFACSKESLVSNQVTENPAAGFRGGKIGICHNGKTISINRNALAAHLAHGDTEGECGPTCVPAELLAGSLAAVSSSTQTLNLAGAEWTVSLNADCSVTFCLKPLLFDNWYSLQALTIGIRTEAEAIADAGGIDLTYLSSDGSTPDDELVSTDGGVTYCYTAPAGSLPSGEVGIFFMVNGRTPNNGADLQRFIGITAMNTPNDWGGFDWSWANRFKITLP